MLLPGWIELFLTINGWMNIFRGPILHHLLRMDQAAVLSFFSIIPHQAIKKPPFKFEIWIIATNNVGGHPNLVQFEMSNSGFDSKKKNGLLKLHSQKLEKMKKMEKRVIHFIVAIIKFSLSLIVNQSTPITIPLLQQSSLSLNHSIK